MQLATRVQELTPSLTLAIDSKAKALKAEGVDVCGFGAGEPDMDTPEHIKAACIEAIQAGFTKYTPSSGMPELRQAISEKFRNDNNLEYKPSQIIVSNGAKQSCFNAVAAVCDPGDEVIIPAPYWLSYPEMVRLAASQTLGHDRGPAIGADDERRPEIVAASISVDRVDPHHSVALHDDVGGAHLLAEIHGQGAQPVGEGTIEDRALNGQGAFAIWPPDPQRTVEAFERPPIGPDDPHSGEGDGSGKVDRLEHPETVENARAFRTQVLATDLRPG